MPTEGQTLTFLEPKEEVTIAAQRIRDALSRLGYSYRTKSGDVIELSYRMLGLVGDVYGLLEVDVQRLPPRVRIDQLVHRETLHHLLPNSQHRFLLEESVYHLAVYLVHHHGHLYHELLLLLMFHYYHHFVH